MTQTSVIDNVIPRADIVQRAARLGAEIGNIKLSGDLSDQTISAINKILLDFGVPLLDENDQPISVESASKSP